jgi:hypothetical protein
MKQLAQTSAGWARAREYWGGNENASPLTSLVHIPEKGIFLYTKNRIPKIDKKLNI